MMRHRLGALGTTVGWISLVLAVACGGSPHDRAEAGMASAVERLTAVHDRLDAIIASVEARPLGGCEAAWPGTDPMLYFGVPDDVREQMAQLSSEYTDAYSNCQISVGVVERELTQARRFRDLFTPDAILRQVTTVRARLASVAPDVLERVLDAAVTDDEVWVALQQVNAPAGRYVGAGQWDSALDEIEELLDRHIEEYGPALSLAVDKRDRFFELAGVPVPER